VRILGIILGVLGLIQTLVGKLLLWRTSMQFAKNYGDGAASSHQGGGGVERLSTKKSWNSEVNNLVVSTATLWIISLRHVQLFDVIYVVNWGRLGNCANWWYRGYVFLLCVFSVTWPRVFFSITLILVFLRLQRKMFLRFGARIFWVPRLKLEMHY
jgi:hypothetical protein